MCWLTFPEVGQGGLKRPEIFWEYEINFFLSRRAYYLNTVFGSGLSALELPWLLIKRPAAPLRSWDCAWRSPGQGSCMYSSQSSTRKLVLRHLTLPENFIFPESQNFRGWKHPEDQVSVFNIYFWDMEPLCVYMNAINWKKYYLDIWHLNPFYKGNYHCLGKTLVNILGIWHQQEPRHQGRNKTNYSGWEYRRVMGNFLVLFLRGKWGGKRMTKGVLRSQK